ncbi:RimJ/RimL family protein N-acetyltransferase [Oxalobacteraceae bacterium GrIS 1.11]
MKILETARLVLRTIDADDAAFYLALVNQPTFLRHIGDKGVRTLEQARAAIVQGPQAMQARHGFSLYLVERKDDLAALGICGLIKRDSLPDVDIGYAIAAQYQGCGYAYEAAVGVLAYAELSLGLPRLLGVAAPDNLQSNRLLLKLGLRFDQFMPPVLDFRGGNVYQCQFCAQLLP